jgi:hypothetical protein
MSHHGIFHHSVPNPDLTHLEAIATHLMLAGKTSEISCGLHFAFPPTDRNGPVCLIWRWVAGLYDRLPDCYLELTAEH